ncbi:hypothetical protein HK413_14120 [Mucilaginibacter sp. S1162]|uniref:Uncharacterized protein n=1 Tax=Mucilaginibacter humi TaxID=2732510 RepID=A0ABX1W3U8_9SPHI|nr:hypothetical protein [Mucilaginibacter humi]
MDTADYHVPGIHSHGCNLDTKLVYKEATAISDEARAIYNGWHQDPDFKGEKKD